MRNTDRPKTSEAEQEVQSRSKQTNMLLSKTSDEVPDQAEIAMET